MSGSDHASRWTSPALATALAQHQAGDWDEAERGYRRILRHVPHHAAALHLLGVLTHQSGRSGEAVRLLLQAITATGAHAGDGGDGVALAEVWNHLGLALQADGQTAVAVTAHRAAVALQPAAAAAHNNLALALEAVGAGVAARCAYAQALCLAPAHPDATVNAALAWQRAGDGGRAVLLLQRAIALTPEDAPLYHALGRLYLEAEFWEKSAPAKNLLEKARRALRMAVLLAPDSAAIRHDLGDALLRLEQPDAAQGRFRQALVLQPDHAGAWAGLGKAALARLVAPAAAISALQRAGRLAPEDGEIWTTLGVALGRVGDHGRAWSCQRRAVVLAPGRAAIWSNLGLAEEAQGQTTAAEVAYDRAAILAPEEPQPRLNRGLLRLARGAVDTGWADYTARFAAERRTTLPLWQGESLKGRRLLVWREQGLGDEILLAATYPILLARAVAEGGSVVLDCDPRLVTLFRRAFPTADVSTACDPQAWGCDSHCPAGAVPGRLHSTTGTITGTSLGLSAAVTGFLRADPLQVTDWQTRLANTRMSPHPTIGLCWRSRQVDGSRHTAYRPLRDWQPIWSCAEALFVSLQYDLGSDNQVAAGMPQIYWPELDQTNDLEATAALISALDLVISAPTAVGELAAALGVPVWRIGDSGDWTTLGSPIRPWLSCQRLFAPAPGEGLDAVLNRAGGALRILLAGDRLTEPA